MENIDIKDYFKISDDHSEVRGFLVVEENGKPIFMKENMVTSNGRKFIKNLCYNSLFGTSSTAVTFSKMKFGTNGAITTTDMTNLKTPESGLEFSKNTTDAKTYSDKITYTLTPTSEDSNIKLELHVKEITSSSLVLREAGLFLSDETMFSRVAFAPLTLKTGNTYKINYYIYF